MAQFPPLKLTDKGMNLLAKAQAGAELQFTCIKIGDGEPKSDSADQLMHERCAFSPIAPPVVEDGYARIDFIVHAVTESGFWFRELGLYANDPDIGEILFSYAHAGELADWIPPRVSSTPYEQTISIRSRVDNASNVTALIGDFAVYTWDDFEKHDRDPNAHAAMITVIQEEAEKAQSAVIELIGSPDDADDHQGRTLFALLKWVVARFWGFWTDARAALLDNLDAKISSRSTQTSVDTANTNINTANTRIGSSPDAASSTGATAFALLKYIVARFTGFWTDTRAALLDRLDAAISSRAAQTTVDTINTNVNTANTNINTINGTKLGASSDAANSAGTTLYALIKYIVARFTGYFTDARAAKLDNLDTTVSSRATQTTADTINNAVGATGNTGGSTTAGTLMAKVNAVLTVLANWTATRAGYLDTINSNVGATGNTGGSTTAGTVMGKLNAVLTNLANWTATRAGKLDNIDAIKAKTDLIGTASVLASTVKSVQRGNTTIRYTGSAGESTVTINTVVPGKCVVIIYSSRGMGHHLGSLTATSLTIYGEVSGGDYPVSYQVVESY